MKRMENPTPWYIDGQTIRDAEGYVVVSAINPCGMATRRRIVEAVNEIFTLADEVRPNREDQGGVRAKTTESSAGTGRVESVRTVQIVAETSGGRRAAVKPCASRVAVATNHAGTFSKRKSPAGGVQSQEPRNGEAEAVANAVGRESVAQGRTRSNTAKQSSARPAPKIAPRKRDTYAKVAGRERADNFRAQTG